MYKPKTTHYLFSYEYLADRYGCERPFGMCPDEWDMKILNCPPDKYIDCFGGLDYVMRYDDYSHHYEYEKLLDWYGSNMHKAEYVILPDRISVHF